MAKLQSKYDVRPIASTDGMIVEELDTELLIYDTARDKAHCLNPAAATVWKHCDGHKTVEELQALIAPEAGAADSRDTIVGCLRDFQRRHLVTGTTGWLDSERQVSRRDLLKRVSVTAAVVVLVPLVTTIAAPTPAAAASCLPGGTPCSTGSQCCSGNCSFGSCGPPLPTRTQPPKFLDWDLL